MNEESINENESQPSAKEESVSEPLETFRAIRDELQDYKERYLRLLAESENARKRLQKERQELTKYAVENAIVEFLHPLDHFEKALQFAESGNQEVKNWAIGFEMILAQFKEVLAHHGVTEYSSIGKMFDPHFHEAVEMVETDEFPPGIIIEECNKGYKMGEKAIRVARVKVAKKKELKPQVPQEENSKEKEI